MRHDAYLVSGRTQPQRPPPRPPGIVGLRIICEVPVQRIKVREFDVSKVKYSVPGLVPAEIIRPEYRSAQLAVTVKRPRHGPPLAHDDVPVDLVGAGEESEVVRFERGGCHGDRGVREKISF